MPKPILQFPCTFPIKVMGLNTPEFADLISAIVVKHVPGTPPEAFSSRLSREDRYIAFTVQIQAQSRQQLDALYLELNAQPLVKMTL